MSSSGGNVDWTLIVLASQKAQAAAEAAASMTTLLESEMGGRVTSIEARITSVEGRLSSIAAGQQGHSLAIMRIADTQADHTARLTRIEAMLGGIEASLESISARIK